MKSYLADRTRCVSVTDKNRSNVGLPFALPHRSVLGPKNHYMYTKSVGEIIKWQHIKYHCYQAYMTLYSCDKWEDILSSIEASIEDISI